jgi:hypothetical protein
MDSIPARLSASDLSRVTATEIVVDGHVMRVLTV